MKNERRDVVLSPCVGICALDDNDVCIGCFRSGQEITLWGRLDTEGKRAVLKSADERLKQNGHYRPIP